MRGYYNLSRNEIAFLCAMFSEVKFNKFSITTPITPDRLRFVKDEFIQKCINAVLKSPKYSLDEKEIRTAKRILEKNTLNEVNVDKFKED